MLARLRSSWWVLPAFIGVLLLCALSMLWNFAHAYIMAGGSNPLVLLEGAWPEWSGTALAIGLASVGADIVKVMSGFILVAVIVNKSLRWYARVGGAVLALMLVVPTLMWSARSAVGMASMAFGDTIATRNTEKVIAKSLTTGVESMSGKLAFLDGQTTCKGAQCTRNTKEAAALRKELKSTLAELKTTKSVGAGDPGGHVIADAWGLSESKVTTWTVILFIGMVEIASILGLPALNLATQLNAQKPKRGDDDQVSPPREDRVPETKVVQREELAANREPAKAPEPPQVVEEDQPPLVAAAVVVPEEAQRSEKATPIHEYMLAPKDKGSRVIPFKGKDTRKHARMDDGHVEEFAHTLADLSGDGKDLVPFRTSVFERYKEFCKEKHLRHMHDKALSNALSRFGIARHRPTGGSVYLRLPPDLGERIEATRQFFANDQEAAAGVAH